MSDPCATLSSLKGVTDHKVNGDIPQANPNTGGGIIADLSCDKSAPKPKSKRKLRINTV